MVKYPQLDPSRSRIILLPMLPREACACVEIKVGVNQSCRQFLNKLNQDVLYMNPGGSMSTVFFLTKHWPDATVGTKKTKQILEMPNTCPKHQTFSLLHIFFTENIDDSLSDVFLKNHTFNLFNHPTTLSGDFPTRNPKVSLLVSSIAQSPVRSSKLGVKSEDFGQPAAAKG